MSFANETPFAALPVPMLDEQGCDVLLVVAKATYTIDEGGALAVASEQHPVRMNDVLRDPDDPNSSVMLPSDLSIAKRGTDVVVVGDAISLKPVESLDLGVQLRGGLVPLRVHGVRVFYEGALGVVSISKPQKFTRMPLGYELAYGGMSEDFALVEMANPVGVGVAKSATDLVGKRAPQLEHPARPHQDALSRHPPVGFGPIASHWSPRREKAGTFDDRWQAERMPILPADYDVSYGNVAHPSLQFDPHLVAGEAIGVIGMSPKPISTRVPPLPIEVRATFDGDERAVVRPPIDTVVVLPDELAIEVALRVALPIGRGKRVLREVVVRTHD